MKNKTTRTNPCFCCISLQGKKIAACNTTYFKNVVFTIIYLTKDQNHYLGLIVESLVHVEFTDLRLGDAYSKNIAILNLNINVHRTEYNLIGLNYDLKEV